MTQQKVIEERDEMSRWLTAHEVAKALGVSTDTVYRLVAEKRLPHLRVRRSIRFRLVDIEAALAGAGHQVSDT